MSVYATIEVLCFFESLRNVDLLEQGMYCIRARLCSDKENYGAPLVSFNTASPLRKARNPRHNIFASYITTTNKAYCTRSFWVQFVEEVIELNEAMLFRIDVSTSDFENLCVTLELELLFSDNESTSSPQLMRTVSQQKYKMMNIGKGLHQFYPVTFDEWHYCIIRAAFHSCLVEFTYKPPTKSFLRLSFSSPTPPKLPLGTDDATDTALLGIPCRTIMKDAFQRLVKKFQLIATRLSNKQQIAYSAIIKLPTLAGVVLSNTLSDVSIAECCEKNTEDFPIRLPTRPVRGALPQDTLVVEIIKQLRFISEQTFELWQRYIVIFGLVGKEDTFRMSQVHEKICIDSWKESFFRERAHVSSLEEMLSIRSNPHKQMAETVRGSVYYKKLKPCPITQLCTKPEASAQPIVFEQVISLRPVTAEDDVLNDKSMDHDNTAFSKIVRCANVKAAKEYEGVHLFVMLHGLLGNVWDMRMFRNQIAYFLPDSEFLICSSVEQMTLTNIEDMGVAVANEIATYISGMDATVGRISFVGHSLGGLILRAALRSEVLQPYQCKLFTFLSLSVPHIGHISSSNAQLIPSAMWVWQKWTNSVCLKQLRLLDHPDPQKTFLYKLSQEKGLEYFQNILLVSSEQDAYVPFHSARIELRKDLISDPKQNSLYLAMVKNLWQPVIDKCSLRAVEVNFPEAVEEDCLFSGLSKRGSSSSFTKPEPPSCQEPTIAVRYDVTFASHRGVDGVIGRAAHIRLLDNAKLIQMFISNNKQYFS